METKLQNKEVLKKIPAVDKVLNWPEISEYHDTFEGQYLTITIRQVINDFRNKVIAGENLDLDSLKHEIIQELKDLSSYFFATQLMQ
jgi:hypothetical protein